VFRFAKTERGHSEFPAWFSDHINKRMLAGTAGDERENASDGDGGFYFKDLLAAAAAAVTNV
jgi:hypothetical protein